MGLTVFRFGRRILALVFVLTVASTLVGAAQFPIPGILNNAKDAAIRQALSEFGTSIGQQLPIVVRTGDAYPTASLSGSPFSPQAAPAGLASILRASRDGTVPLPPGDYEFTVDVFCMKSYAHSPSGHRYLVAPLHGAAADIFQALNSRIPSFSLNHFAVQVLSWDIQAGLSYSEMRAQQRAIVDQVIPDYKNRLAGDLYDNIRNQYEHVVGRVPGMPSFEDALGRLGPVGQDMVQLQMLRQQMLQPPKTPEELARELVPFASLIPSAAGGSGATPWSRYSDQVLVRFITSGNYATPGKYQVRVLPARGSLAAPDPADVPFSNIVNNPGDNGVQPLTQAPQPGNQQPQPQPTSSPPVSITSETVADIPFDRSRTTVGVGEQVVLTFSGASAHWSLSGGQGAIDPVGKSVTYRASITPATETITATDLATSQSATITFEVIAPQAVADEFIDGTLVHNHNEPDIGMGVFIYLQPDTVSFQFIDVKELEVPAKTTGVYSVLKGSGHGPNPVPLPIVEVDPGKGSKVAGSDEVYSGGEGAQAPFAPGSITFDIPYVYGALSKGAAGPFYSMGIVVQKCDLYEYGGEQLLHATKAGANAYSKVTDPTVP